MPYIERDGVKVYYESYGQGVPVVFLHPFSTNGYIWYFQTFTFARDYRCVIVDHRGHGRSDKPASGYAIREMSRDVAAILDALGIDKAVLVGNSIGGMIAMQFNLDFPDRVIGNLILSSGTNLAASMPPEAGAAFQEDLEAAFRGLLDGTVSARSKKERPEILDLMNASFMIEENFPHAVFHASAADPEGVFNWDVSDRLREISRPTLVIAGEEDQGTPVEVNQFLADQIPGAEIKIIPEVGHFYQLERPVDFNNELREFLKRVA